MNGRLSLKRWADCVQPNEIRQRLAAESGLPPQSNFGFDLHAWPGRARHQRHAEDHKAQWNPGRDWPKPPQH